MARILFSEFSNVTWVKGEIFDSHAEGFIRALRRNNNEVLCVRTNRFVKNQLTNELIDQVDENKVLKVISNFSPEVIISYNNSFPGNSIIEETDCPIIVYPADVPLYWCSIDMIRHYFDRYFFLSVNETMDKQIVELFGEKAKNKIIEFGYVTEVYSKSVIQDIAVSFVGSIGNYADAVVSCFQKLCTAEKTFEEKNEIKNVFFDALDTFASDTTKDIQIDFLKDNLNGYDMSNISPALILMMTCNKRYEILRGISDLGLSIFGYGDSWAKVMQYDYNLFRCFNYRTIATLEDSIDIYNRSVISLNLPHGNSGVGFSWRVCDILASNAALVSVKKADLVKLMSEYFPIKCFESDAEARELIKYVLDDSAYRKELVQASNAMINDKCRYDKKLQYISEWLSTNCNVKMGDHDGNTARTRLLDVEDMYLDEIIEERIEFRKYEVDTNAF